ncbi:unnamed protein product [Didymodactylos carnosus]|uniref:Acetyl-CoA acetyltransferase n=1 Tax=Didymodactylos carnosus TaxID=1234261 RepID=A0A813NKA6_9BILA|nr:unnamed protein product [Didymodactylos carnosus]CAF0739439.1 unnamed protein product [Didymodactylos carnosus]CAF3492362.1 unnamed protein product [Didymodactylos carnosus]CAF3517605.1 unnamed protein product [Didymodactylos carnosus]
MSVNNTNSTTLRQNIITDSTTRIVSSLNTTASSAIKTAITNEWKKLDRGTLIRGMIVLVGITALILLYIGVKTFALRKKRQPKRYTLINNTSEPLMSNVLDEDEEVEDNTLYLGGAAIKAALSKANVNLDEVSEVIMGQCLTASEGQNPARQAARSAGLAYTIPAFSVNMVCGSGLKAVILGAQAIKSGDALVVIAGGQESMSQAPHCVHIRQQQKLGDCALVDTLKNDGLIDAFNHVHMGITAENVAETYGITRQEQDEFALQSQLKCEHAMSLGHFDNEIEPITLATAKGGTVTAGNSSGINDGAAALVLCSNRVAHLKQQTPLAKIISWAQVGIDPLIMGIAPVKAIQDALRKAEWTIDMVDLFELNEAFAAQSVAVIHELKINPEKININGGAIALGHPIGASGARILVTLIHALKRTGLKRGVASLCIGGGLGIAMCIESL